MKNHIALLLLLCGVVIAAPKNSLSNLTSCLWNLLSDGSITANGVTISPDASLMSGNGGFSSPFVALASGSYTDAGGPISRRIDLFVAPDEDWFRYAFASIETTQAGANYGARLILESESVLGGGSVTLVADQSGGRIGTGADEWRLGSVIPATVQLVTDRYVQVEIGGQIVKLAIVE